MLASYRGSNKVSIIFKQSGIGTETIQALKMVPGTTNSEWSIFPLILRVWFDFGMTWWHDEAVEIIFRSMWNEKKIAMTRWLTNEKKCTCVKEKNRGLWLRVLGTRPRRGLLSHSARSVISIMSLYVSLHPVMWSCSEGIGLPIGEVWQSCFSKMW